MFLANLFQLYVLDHHEVKEELEAPDIDYKTPLQLINEQEEEYRKDNDEVECEVECWDQPPTSHSSADRQSC